MYLSVISTVRNEEENLEELHRRITDVCVGLGKPYEIIYVENGSTDNSRAVLKELKGATILILRAPVPPDKTMQTAALDAGIKASKGSLIVTIDSDLQNPPEEIPRMIDMLEKQDLDVVSGWRKRRKDSFVIRSLSLIGSKIRRMIIDPGVHDLGCTLKVYRRECFESLDLYGEMHRYIVAILKWRGFQIGEMIVGHAERKRGRTNYSWKKMFRGFVDMILIWFLKKYSDRPLHLFGVWGLFISMSGIFLLGVLGILRVFNVISLSQSIFPLISVLLVIVGFQFVVFGIMMDMLMRNYFAIGKESGYSIKERVEV